MTKATVALATGLALATAAPVTADDRPNALRAPAAADAAARAAVAALPRATAVNDANANRLFDDLDRAYAQARPGERLRVIVSFTDGTSTREGVAAARAAAAGAVVGRTFTIVPAFAGELSATDARRIARLDAVRQIELDRRGVAENDVSTRVMGADAVVDALGTTGSLDGDVSTHTTGDVGIGILDSGFHTGHQDLAGKLVDWVDLGTGRAEPYDDNGHGTHVASIAAGRGVDPEMRGVAPGASIIGLKIEGGAGSASNALAGFEYLVERREALNVRVATISYGFGTATDGTTALERAVDAAWDAGITAFKSNGNSGPGFGTMTVPAAARGILAVGSLLAASDDPARAILGFSLSQYSSRGPTSDGRIKPDITAPGESIRAALTKSEDGYTVKSGTSMASPFAAGTAALMSAADPSLTPDDIRAILRATAQDWGAAGPDTDYGHGRIQVYEAVTEVLRRRGAAPGTEAAPVVPLHESFTATPANGVFETKVTVTDTAFPVSITALGSAAVGAIAVTDPSGAAVQATAAPNTSPDRQHNVRFRPTALGVYTIRVVAPPSSPLVVDVSHSVAR